jgi:very-short-patch-repair endonuclease
MDISHFFNAKGRVSSTKTNEKYLLKNFPSEHLKVATYALELGIQDLRFPEKLFYFYNKIGEKIVCKNCGSQDLKFFGLKSGYSSHCSYKCSNSSEEVKKAKEESYMKKYGVTNPSYSSDVILKIQNTFQERFGGNPMQLDLIKNKVKQTNIERYGQDNILKKGSLYREKKEVEDRNYFLEKYSNLNIIDFEYEKNGQVRIQCKECKSIFKISKWNLHQRNKAKMSNPCTSCFPIGMANLSSCENFVKDILDEAGIIYHGRKRGVIGSHEIDFYIESMNVGFEINGNYWHSDLYKENQYHIKKTRSALKNGLNLYHIFEDEIMFKQDQVKKRILAILGIGGNPVQEENFDIREINSDISKEFMNDNHVLGYSPSSLSIGLFVNEILTSVMCLSKLRRISDPGNNKWEITRIHSLVADGSNKGYDKMLSYFINSHSPAYITSYCDRRWYSGQDFLDIGFSVAKKTSPNYWYINKKDWKVREPRSAYRKSNFVNEGESINQKEASIMNDRG